MVRTRETPHNRRVSDQSIEQLRANLAAGLPWRQPETPDEALGYGDLIFIESGHHYALACDFIREKDDAATLVEVWSEIREDFLREHIRRKPGSRPWAWWRENREQRRVIRIDKKMLACDGGRIYETEREYLARFDLLTSEEIKLSLEDR